VRVFPMAGGPLDFDVMAFFKEEVMNESAAIRINAINNCHLIASALGPAKIINDLIPYLSHLVQEAPRCNEDEFLFSAAKQCALLADEIPGQNDLLLPLLERLASEDETVIREQAIASLCAIGGKNPAIVTEHLVPMLHRLATKSDFFTGRVSACSLMPMVYKYATEEQRDGIRTAYVSLCSNEMPMVRRAAAHKLRDFIEACVKQDLTPDLIGVYKQLSQEGTQDTIRLSCVYTTLVMAPMLSQEENRQTTLAVIKDATEDQSWRVRLTVAKQFDQLCQAFGPEITKDHLLHCLVQLLKDSEQEVRKEAIRILEVCVSMPNPLTVEQLTTMILPHFAALREDPAQTVRAALAHIMGPMAKACGKDVLQRWFLAPISDLMKDENHEVRLNVVAHTGVIFEVIQMDSVTQSLLPTIQACINDQQWRIRRCVVEQVPRLAKLFGVEMFQAKLETMLLASLRDSVHAVREAAIDNMKYVAECFGGTWTVEHLLPQIVEQYSQSAGYACRLTTMHVLPKISGVLDQDQIGEFVVPMLQKAAKDPVPNVRFYACRTIQGFLEQKRLSSASIASTIKPTLQELKEDTDSDVKYYAMRALDACGA